jgi:hypothetical protein
MKILYAYSSLDANTGYKITIPANKTNSKTIIGEVSPYITSVSPNPANIGDKFIINGIRLNDSTSFGFPSVYIDGEKVSGVDGTKDGTAVFFVLPQLSAGNHIVYLENVNGKSNNVGFTVDGPVSIPVVTASINSSSPDASILQTPQSDVILALINLRAGSDPVNNLNNIQIGSDSVNAASKINNIRAYLGNTLIGSVQGLTSNGEYYYGWIPVNGLSISASSTISIKLVADLLPQNSETKLRLGITGLNFDGNGAYTSGVPIYGAENILVPLNWLGVDFVSSSNSVMSGPSANDDVGTFKIRFKVTAFGGDVYMASTTNYGYTYIVEKNGVPVSSANVSSVITNITDTNLSNIGNHHIEEGNSEIFDLEVLVPMGSDLTSGQYRVSLVGINWDKNDVYPQNLNKVLDKDIFKTSYRVLN